MGAATARDDALCSALVGKDASGAAAADASSAAGAASGVSAHPRRTSDAATNVNERLCAYLELIRIPDRWLL